MSVRPAPRSSLEVRLSRGGAVGSIRQVGIGVISVAIAASSNVLAQPGGSGLKFARVAQGEPRWIEPCAKLADEMLIWLDRMASDTNSNLQDAAKRQFARSVFRLRPLKAHPEHCNAPGDCFRIGETNADSAKFYRNQAQGAVRSARNIAQNSPSSLKELDDFEIARAEAFAKVYYCLADGVERN